MSNSSDIQNIFLSLRSSLARSVVGIVPPVEIEDIVQETYVRVCQIKNQEDIRAPRSFLFRTARNLALDHAKRAETRLADSQDDALGPAPYDVAQSSDVTFGRVASDAEFCRFCEAVRRLPVQCRRVFVLKKVYGFTQREISRELNLSESTVEKHIAQGIKRCSYYMMRHENSSGSKNLAADDGRTTNTANSRQGGNS